jgi:hypothetical protein
LVRYELCRKETYVQAKISFYWNGDGDIGFGEAKKKNKKRKKREIEL